jgi:hypothetical protein
VLRDGVWVLWALGAGHGEGMMEGEIGWMDYVCTHIYVYWVDCGVDIEFLSLILFAF